MANSTSFGKQYNMKWDHVMVRVKDPNVTIPFWSDHLQLRKVREHKGDSFALIFMESAKPSPTSIKIELTHNFGTESDPKFQAATGNIAPLFGFNRILFGGKQSTIENLAKEEKWKVVESGKYKWVSANDPDGYAFSVVPYADSQEGAPLIIGTSIRVKNLDTSAEFYTNVLGFTLVLKLNDCCPSDSPFDGKVHTSWVLAMLSDEERSAFEAIPKDNEEKLFEFAETMKGPVIELLHCKEDDTPVYHNGNAPEPQGYGHIAFHTDELAKVCEEMEAAGVKFKKRPTEGRMHHIAFIYDPDMYWIELIAR